MLYREGFLVTYLGRRRHAKRQHRTPQLGEGGATVLRTKWTDPACRAWVAGPEGPRGWGGGGDGGGLCRGGLGLPTLYFFLCQHRKTFSLNWLL